MLEDSELKIKKQSYSVLTVLILLTFLGIGLVCFRMYKTETSIYRFLIWNLFLAWIPLLSALGINKQGNDLKSKFLVAGMFFLWLLFFPNSPYILTDLFHLVDIRDKVPMWYDLVLVLTFAWTGLIIGLFSLFEIHLFLKKKFKALQSWTIITVLIFLGSFGVYLGRFQRWNSWNIVTHPGPLFADLFSKIFNPLANLEAMGFTLFFAIFLFMAYLTLYAVSEIKN